MISKLFFAFWNEKLWFFAHEFSFLHHLKADICINFQIIIKNGVWCKRLQTFLLRRYILSFIRYLFFYCIYLMLFFQLWHILQRRLLQTPRPMLKGMCQLFNTACFYSSTTMATREPLNFENWWLLAITAKIAPSNTKLNLTFYEYTRSR